MPSPTFRALLPFSILSIDKANQSQGSRRQGNVWCTPRPIEWVSNWSNSQRQLLKSNIYHSSLSNWFSCPGGRQLYTSPKWQMRKKFPAFENRDWMPHLADLLDPHPGWVGLTPVSSLSDSESWPAFCACPWLLSQEALKLPFTLDSWSSLRIHHQVLGWNEHGWPCLCWCWSALSPNNWISTCSSAISLADVCQGLSQPVACLRSCTPSYYSPKHLKWILL